mmetsp:Transcript_16662/g.25058  ORF Transcript_16662/g.25058 Transcript_16662/m.25058 type:complete len:81 (-) Transcript_16662:2-244(-)
MRIILTTHKRRHKIIAKSREDQRETLGICYHITSRQIERIRKSQTKDRKCKSTQSQHMLRRSSTNHELKDSSNWNIYVNM